MQASDPLDPRAVLRAVKARSPSATAGLDRAEHGAIDVLRAGTKERPLARTKELRDMRSKR
jgi:hypothetical protein